ncbi:MAG TPA: HEAT repeat domain-containing protein, partial [Planctomycetota bacterium]|nr:HEAT repeat domain-containing protein [Planctomycetota bacterium]
GRLGSPAARGYLMDLAKSKDPAARKEAIQGLLASGDPGALDELLRLAQSDKSADVRKLAREALPAAGLFGTAAERRANAAKLKEAAPKAPAELKKAIADTIANLETDLPAGPAADLNALAAAWSATPPDTETLAKLLESAAPGDVAKLDKMLRGQGKSLSTVLEALRTGSPAGYAKVMDAFTAAAADMPDERGDVYRGALVDHLKGAPADAVRAYAARNVVQPNGGSTETIARRSEAAAMVLARAGSGGSDAAVGALLEFGVLSRGGDGWAETPAVRALLDKIPADRIDRIADVVSKTSTSAAAKDNAALLEARAGTAAGKKAAAAYFETEIAAKNRALAAEGPKIDQEIAEREKRLQDYLRMGSLSVSWGDPAVEGTIIGDIENTVSDIGYEIRGKAHLPDSELKRLEQAIAGEESKIRELKARKEKLAADATQLLQAPEVGKVLATLPAERVRALVEGATNGISGTEAGRMFAKSLEEGAEKPEEHPLWQKVFEGTNKGRETAMKILEHVAPELILEGEKAVQKGMGKLLGLDRAADVAKLEDAVDKMKYGTKAEREEAEKVLDGMGLKSYVNKLDALFSAVDLAIGLKELVEDPTARKAIESAKSTADLVKKLGPWISKSARMAKFVKAAGGVSKAAEAVIALLDTREDLTRGDLGGAAGDALDYVGAALLAADAIPGVDGLAIPGTVLVAAGKIVKITLGDTEQEKKLKALADKYGYKVEGGALKDG